LLPLSLHELSAASKLPDLNTLLAQGFYPRLYSNNEIVASELLLSYFETYVQKDVRQILNVKDMSLFQKFIGLCAGRIGQLLNKESLASDVGINVKTVEEWISVLEASFVLFRLQPFWRNSRKRLVKSPKIYFYDVGLASWLLRIYEGNSVVNSPYRGNLFENMIIVEALKSKFNAGKNSNLFFYRDGRKRELDLVFDEAESVFPIEIKSAATYDSSFAKNFALLDDYGKRGCAVALGADKGQSRSDVDIVSWREFPGYMKNQNLV
jgi:predicted AAA+ superfamily ATPase